MIFAVPSTLSNFSLKKTFQGYKGIRTHDLRDTTGALLYQRTRFFQAYKQLLKLSCTAQIIPLISR